MTEPEWLACGNPARLLKRLRDWDNHRRYILLACAYVRDALTSDLLYVPDGTIEHVRRIAFDGPRKGFATGEMGRRLADALGVDFPFGLPLFFTYSPGAERSYPPGPNDTFGEVMRVALHDRPRWTEVNAVSAALERHLRHRARAQPGHDLYRICRNPPS
ncbi:MAG: hypothetical protein K2V38_11275, partial [Gemmataceae bacterium]|nr:hypothetical protein [Gemmataceae bacterium]